MRQLLKHIRLSFTAKLVGLIVLFTVAFALALNSYFHSMIKQELYVDLVEHGGRLVRLLAGSSRLGVFTGDVEVLQEPAQMIYLENVCEKVFIYNSKGGVLVGLGDDTDAEVAFLSSRAIYAEVSSSLGATSKPFPEQGKIICGYPVLPDRIYEVDDLFLGNADSGSALHGDAALQPIGYVAVVLNTENLTGKVGDLLLHTLSVTLVLVLVCSVGIFLLVRRLTKPLRGLVREIIRHKPDALENGRRTMDADFSKMIGIIQDSYRALSDLKINLEIKVRQRTNDLYDQKQSLEIANGKLEQAFRKLKKAQEHIIHTEKMASLGLVVGGISHEIKNSVNFISSSLPLLKKNLEVEFDGGDSAAGSRAKRRANIAKLLGFVAEGVSRTLGVIEDLANFSYDSTDEFEKTDMLPGLRSSVALVRHEYKNRIEFLEFFDCDHLMVLGNHAQINQVFMNLLLNAVKAIADTGTVRVRVQHFNDKVMISIKDSGTGVDPENMDKLFDPFFTTRKVGEGIGLGLSLSYTIIKKHGGQITVESSPGEGALFTIILPSLS